MIFICIHFSNRQRVEEQWNQFNKLLEKYALWSESDVLKEEIYVSQINEASFLLSDELFNEEPGKIRTNTFLLRNSRKRSSSFSSTNSSTSSKRHDKPDEHTEISRVKIQIENELKSPMKELMEKRVEYMNSTDTENFLCYDKKVKCEILRLRRYISEEEISLYFKYLLRETIKSLNR